MRLRNDNYLAQCSSFNPRTSRRLRLRRANDVGHADKMSERNLQRALIYLYTHVHEYRAYSDELFVKFRLSKSERQSLKELMTLQWEGLIAFNQQLHHKQRRYIRHALPKSRTVYGQELENLLTLYTLRLPTAAEDQSTAAVQSFAQYLTAKIEREVKPSKALEFIRFEAVYASLLLLPFVIPSSAPQSLHFCSESRLSSGGTSVLLACSYSTSPQQ